MTEIHLVFFLKQYFKKLIKLCLLELILGIFFVHAFFMFFDNSLRRNSYETLKKPKISLKSQSLEENYSTELSRDRQINTKIDINLKWNDLKWSKPS